MTKVRQSLSTVIALKRSLTPSEVDSAVELLGKGCREKTKRQLRSVLKYGLSTIPVWGIYERLMFEAGEAHYTAGQSYPDEIRTLRNALLGR